MQQVEAHIYLLTNKAHRFSNQALVYCGAVPGPDAYCSDGVEERYGFDDVGRCDRSES